MRRLCVLLGVVCLVLPTAAQAGTVEYEPPRSCDRYSCDAFLHLRAAPGEVNVITSRSEADRKVVTDRGAPLTAGTGCWQVDEHSVSCPFGFLGVDLGDGDDVLDTHASGTLGAGNDRASTSGSIWGGEGDDVLVSPAGGIASFHGEGGDDRLEGSDSRDELYGGPGADTLVGGGGDDSLYATDYDRPASPGSERPTSDQIDGGAGADTVVYAERSVSGITADLAAGRAGSPGEQDSLLGVEQLSGTRVDDRIVGSDQAEGLGGNGGRDVIDGGAGDDRVFGGGESPDGGDQLVGGAGNDTVVGDGDSLALGGPGDDVLAPSANPRSACGGGRDVIRAYERLPGVPLDCELLEFQFGGTTGHIQAHPTVEDGRMVLGVPCPPAELHPFQEPPLIMSPREERAWLKLGLLTFGCRVTVVYTQTGGRSQKASMKVRRHRRGFPRLPLRRPQPGSAVDVRIHLIDDVRRRHRSYSEWVEWRAVLR